MVKIVGLAEAFSLVTPWYNLVLIVFAIVLFLFLFNSRIKKEDLGPWKFVFFAVIVAFVEEVLTAFRSLGWVVIPVHVNGFFEVVIVVLLLYALLLRRKSL